MALFEIGNGRDPSVKIISDYGKLAKAADGLRAVGCTIVVTIGSFDVLHIGHDRYLLKAKSQGDVLIVGVDSDRATRQLKGKRRPLVPEGERCEMLSFQTFVDFVCVIDDVDRKGRWHFGLLKAVRPDVFVAEETSYSKAQLRDIRRFCKRIVVLPRQAKKTSTSHLVQNVLKEHVGELTEISLKLKKVLEDMQ
jgi:D-glycero-beta-D-manno-heptose 1-phosphate adenylyltransferase